MILSHSCSLSLPIDGTYAAFKAAKQSLTPARKTDFTRFFSRPEAETTALLQAMAACGTPVSTMAAALFLSIFEVRERARALGLALNSTSPKRGSVGRPWNAHDIAILSRFWTDGQSLRAIAERLDRSLESVRKKRRTIGLPARALTTWSAQETQALIQAWESGSCLGDIAAQLGRTKQSIHGKRRRLQLVPSRSAIPSDPSIILTWQQASQLSPEQRRGRRWQVRNSPTGLVVGFKKSVCSTKWTPEMHFELAQRHFSRQAPAAVAEDFLMTERAVVSQSNWLHLPRRLKKTLCATFCPELAVSEIARLDYVRRECLGKKGYFFWSERRNGNRVSRLHKQSVAMKIAC